MAAYAEIRTFESFLREKRLKRKIGLREFARIIGMQPSNYCSIESGSLPAPSEDKLRNISKALALELDEERVLFDLAAKTKDDIPADIKELIKRDSVIPALLRTVEDEEVGHKEIKAIVRDIKSGRYRRPSK